MSRIKSLRVQNYNANAFVSVGWFLLAILLLHGMHHSQALTVRPLKIRNSSRFLRTSTRKPLTLMYLQGRGAGKEDSKDTSTNAFVPNADVFQNSSITTNSNNKLVQKNHGKIRTTSGTIRNSVSPTRKKKDLSQKILLTFMASTATVLYEVVNLHSAGDLSHSDWNIVVPTTIFALDVITRWNGVRTQWSGLESDCKDVIRMAQAWSRTSASSSSSANSTIIAAEGLKDGLSSTMKVSDAVYGVTRSLQRVISGDTDEDKYLQDMELNSWFAKAITIRQGEHRVNQALDFLTDSILSLDVNERQRIEMIKTCESIKQRCASLEIMHTPAYNTNKNWFNWSTTWLSLMPLSMYDSFDRILSFSSPSAPSSLEYVFVGIIPASVVVSSGLLALNEFVVNLEVNSLPKIVSEIKHFADEQAGLKSATLRVNGDNKKSSPDPRSRPTPKKIPFYLKYGPKQEKKDSLPETRKKEEPLSSIPEIDDRADDVVIPRFEEAVKVPVNTSTGGYIQNLDRFAQANEIVPTTETVQAKPFTNEVKTSGVNTNPSTKDKLLITDQHREAATEVGNESVLNWGADVSIPKPVPEGIAAVNPPPETPVGEFKSIEEPIFVQNQTEEVSIASPSKTVVDEDIDYSAVREVDIMMADVRSLEELMNSKNREIHSLKQRIYTLKEKAEATKKRALDTGNTGVDINILTNKKVEKINGSVPNPVLDTLQATNDSAEAKDIVEIANEVKTPPSSTISDKVSATNNSVDNELDTFNKELKVQVVPDAVGKNAYKNDNQIISSEEVIEDEDYTGPSLQMIQDSAEKVRRLRNQFSVKNTEIAAIRDRIVSLDKRAASLQQRSKPTNIENSIELFIAESRRKIEEKKKKSEINPAPNSYSSSSVASSPVASAAKSKPSGKTPTTNEKVAVDPLRAMIADMKAIKDELRSQLDHLDRLKESIQDQDSEVSELESQNQGRNYTNDVTR